MVPSSRTEWAILAGLAALLCLLPLAATPYYLELGSYALIMAMLALSLQLLVGAAGIVSLGHAAFYGIAAYTVYLVTPEAGSRPIWLTLPAAVAVAGLAAFLVGAVSLRTRGFFFLMVTLAFGQMAFFLFHDTKLGGGADGAFLNRPALSLFGLEWQPSRRERPFAIYYLCLGLLVAMYAFLVVLLKSLFGRALDGIRVNEHRMQALGHNTIRLKLAAFTIAGALAGVAGHMWAMHRGFVSPELVGWHRSAETLLMILLGGLRSLTGGVVGALLWVGLAEASQLLTQRRQLVEGLVILAIVLALPAGIMGLLAPRNAKADDGDPEAPSDLKSSKESGHV